MKKIFLLSFLVLGLSSLIAQVMILRELMVSFYGNEFFIGFLLAVWVLWVALGSFLVGKIKLASQPSWLYVLTFILTSLLLAGEIILIRYLNNFGVAAGQLANLVPALLGSVFLPAPLCLNLGAQFALAAKAFSQKNPAVAINQIYLWESLGFVAGGILFSFWLVKLNEFSVLSLLASINLFVGLVLSYFLAPKNLTINPRTYLIGMGVKISCLVLLAGFLFLSFWAAKINQKTLTWRFGGQELIKSLNSRYGNLAVTQTDSQYNFYESGLFLGTDKEIQNNEYFAHLALVQHPKPKNVLIIGGGFNGLINEVLKHPVQKLTYLELDNQLLPLAIKYLPEDIRTGLTDPRVQILNLDGRYFIKRSTDKFDFILINLPSPATALINRFYTQDFLQEAASRLNPDGILATQLPFSPEYQNIQLAQLNNSLFKTLKTVFPKVVALPENINIFLASSGQILSDQPSVLVARFKERQIETSFLTENYLLYRLTNERIVSFLNSTTEDKTTQINQDFKPISYLYSLSYWLTYFYPQLTEGLTKIFKLNFWWLSLAILLAIFLGWLFNQRKRPETVLILNMGIFGFIIMAGEIIFVLLYQTLFGYLYYKIAWLIALLMAGLALGTWHGKRQTQRKNISNLSVIKIQLLLILFTVYCFLFTVYLPFKSEIFSELIFYATIFIFGYLGGFGFPYLNHLYLHTNEVQAKLKFGAEGASTSSGVGVYLTNKKDPETKKVGEGVNLSLLYSADLAGAALGAILPALLLLPLWGLNQTLFFIIIINLAGIFLLLAII